MHACLGQVGGKQGLSLSESETDVCSASNRSMGSQRELLLSLVRCKCRRVETVRDRICESGWHAVILPLSQVFLALVDEAASLNMTSNDQNLRKRGTESIKEKSAQRDTDAVGNLRICGSARGSRRVRSRKRADCSGHGPASTRSCKCGCTVRGSQSSAGMRPHLCYPFLETK